MFEKRRKATDPFLIQLVKRNKPNLLGTIDLAFKVQGNNIIQKDEDGLNALHWAVKLGKRSYVKKFLDENYPVNGTDNKNWTPLHYAVMSSHAEALEIIQLLLQRGADSTLQNNDGTSSINLIFIRNSLSEQEFKDSKLDYVKIKFIQGLKLKILQLLIAYDKKLINYQDKDGRTLLHLCVSGTDCQKVEMAAFLMDSGADPNIPDNNGHVVGDIITSKIIQKMSSTEPSFLRSQDLNSLSQVPGTYFFNPSTNVHEQDTKTDSLFVQAENSP